MSRPNESMVSASMIDRLVDGELDEGERQHVLALLESDPDGWRRCALAFLEAQAWTRTFTSASESLAFGNGGTAAHSSRAAGPPTIRRLRRAGSLAAGILLAFAAGWLANATIRPINRSPEQRQPLVVSAVERTAEAPKSDPDLGRFAQDRPDLDRPEFADARVPEEFSWEEGAHLLFTEPVLRRLEQSGYRIEKRTGLMTTQLEDGRSVAVPVDELEFRYEGNRTF